MPILVSPAPSAHRDGPPPAALPSAAAANYMGIAGQTLSNWRSLGEGPPYVRLGQKPGGRVVYRVGDLDEFLAAHLIGGTK